MVTSLDAFVKYHTESAWLWERQAMIKARPVAGDPGFMKEMDRIIKETVFRKGFNEGDRMEMHRMKEKIISEHKTKGYNLKYSPGGLVELEFIVQSKQLEFGSAYEKLRTPSTKQAISNLVSEGIIHQEDGEILLHSYEFLRKLENRIRLLYDYSHDNMPDSEEELQKLEKVFIFDKSEKERNLVELFIYWTKKVNLLYNKFFEIT